MGVGRATHPRAARNHRLLIRPQIWALRAHYAHRSFAAPLFIPLSVYFEETWQKYSSPNTNMYNKYKDKGRNLRVTLFFYYNVILTCKEPIGSLLVSLDHIFTYFFKLHVAHL